MQSKTVITGVVFLFLFCLGTSNRDLRAGDGLPFLFESIRTGLSSLPLSAEQDTNVRSLLDFAEQKASDGVTGYYTAGRLIDAFLIEMVIPLLVVDVGEAVEEVIDDIVDDVDSIRGLLFAGAPPLLIDTPEALAPPAGSCNVTIVFRVFGPAGGDPGGILRVPFSDFVELEAVATPPGGTFTWGTPSAVGEFTFRQQNNRAVFRVTEDTTFAIEVYYEGPGGEFCQDTVWVQAEGGGVG